MRFSAVKHLTLLTAVGLLSASCSQLDDDRIPSMPVYINLGDTGLWNVYGVSGVGDWTRFIKDLSEPANFSYTSNQNTYTGFGGVLLIGGLNPFDPTIDEPLAYDLACPVECRRNVRVYIDPNNLEAVCPECGSRYNVLTAGGASLSGPAYTNNPRYGLTRYECLAAQNGGYLIRD